MKEGHPRDTPAVATPVRDMLGPMQSLVWAHQWQILEAGMEHVWWQIPAWE